MSAQAGGLIHQLRVARGISRNSLARRVNVRTSVLAGIEQGRAQPSVRLLDQLARQLGTSLADLMRLRPGGRAPARPGDLRAALEQVGRQIAELPVGVGNKIDAAGAAAALYAVRACGGNHSAAARVLGIERKAPVRRVVRVQNGVRKRAY